MLHPLVVPAVAICVLAVALSTPCRASAGSTAFLREVGPCRTTTAPGSDLLSARFWHGDLDTLLAGYDESAVVAGTLTDPGGAPLAGTQLCIEEQLIGAGAEPGDRVVVPRTGLAQTDAGGHYLYRLPAGPSREVVVVYRGLLGESIAAVRYFAPVRPTLHIAPRRTHNRGRPVRFWGKLPGPHSRGRVVVLQVARGKDGWITFRHMTTDDKGRFETDFLFNRTPYDYTYTFRALVPRQAGYPWLPGSSLLGFVEVMG